MKKRVFIIHGWEGHPEEGWFPWLKRSLEEKGFEVSVPHMPDADNPRIFNWIPVLTKTIRNVDDNTYFVGHSVGCQAIVRYLEGLPNNVKVGGAVFVAGFFKRLTNLEDDSEVKATAKHWLESPINFYKVKSHLPKSIAIFSDNDPWVPLDTQQDFKQYLGSKIVIEKQRGHFSGSDGLVQLPSALDSVLELSKK